MVKAKCYIKLYKTAFQNSFDLKVRSKLVTHLKLSIIETKIRKYNVFRFTDMMKMIEMCKHVRHLQIILSKSTNIHRLIFLLAKYIGPFRISMTLNTA